MGVHCTEEREVCLFVVFHDGLQRECCELWLMRGLNHTKYIREKRRKE